jgi:hypothetical protein
MMTAPSELMRSYSPFATRGPMSSTFRRACSTRYCIPLILKLGIDVGDRTSKTYVPCLDTNVRE